MRIRLLATSDVILPLFLMALGGVGTLLAAHDWNRPFLALCVGIVAAGGIWYRYLWRHSGYIVFCPSGFSIMEGDAYTDVAWDQLRGVQTEVRGQYSSVEISWQDEGGATIKRQFPLTHMKAFTIETQLVSYWHHPERRLGLQSNAAR